jgi:hypothetical protein
VVNVHKKVIREGGVPAEQPHSFAIDLYRPSIVGFDGPEMVEGVPRGHSGSDNRHALFCFDLIRGRKIYGFPLLFLSIVAATCPRSSPRIISRLLLDHALVMMALRTSGKR